MSHHYKTFHRLRCTQRVASLGYSLKMELLSQRVGTFQTDIFYRLAFGGILFKQQGVPVPSLLFQTEWSVCFLDALKSSQGLNCSQGILPFTRKLAPMAIGPLWLAVVQSPASTLSSFSFSFSAGFLLLPSCIRAHTFSWIQGPICSPLQDLITPVCRRQHYIRIGHLQQSISKVSVPINHLEILLQCRFFSSG